MIYRLWAYFRRGHGTYLALSVSLLNFVTIQYSLTPLQGLFSNLIMFGLVFFLVYALIATGIGWFDMKRGSLSAEQTLMVNANPYIMDSVRFNIALCKSLRNLGAETEEAQAIMERWLERV